MKHKIKYVDVDVNTCGKTLWVYVRVWRNDLPRTYKKQKKLTKAHLLQNLLIQRSGK